MANKVKFIWTFEVIQNNTKLEVGLNGGTNTIFDLRHPNALMNISSKLAEVLRYQYDIGNKTEIPPLDTREIYKALSIASEILEANSHWDSVIKEADQQHKERKLKTTKGSEI